MTTKPVAREKTQHHAALGTVDAAFKNLQSYALRLPRFESQLPPLPVVWTRYLSH